ncbi:MAG: hypothetical protein HC846_04175 [Blastocatellia bacterium]|nr:hypothetical protein [Blastocatellia bacterium]
MTLKKTIFLIILILIGTCVLVAWSSINKQGQDRVQIENRIPAIGVVSLREKRKLKDSVNFELIIRNVSNRPIIAVTLRHENSQESPNTIETSAIDGLSGDWRLMPNAAANMFFSVPLTGNAKVIIASVMYEDGATEGDAFLSEQMKNKREGIKFALQKFIPILQKGKNLPTEDIPDEIIQALTNEVINAEKQGVPQTFLRGFIDTKNLVISDLNELKRFKQEQRNNPEFTPKNHFQKRLNSLERTFSKL